MKTWEPSICHIAVGFLICIPTLLLQTKNNANYFRGNHPSLLATAKRREYFDLTLIYWFKSQIYVEKTFQADKKNAEKWGVTRWWCQTYGCMNKKVGAGVKELASWLLLCNSLVLLMPSSWCLYWFSARFAPFPAVPICLSNRFYFAPPLLSHKLESVLVAISGWLNTSSKWQLTQKLGIPSRKSQLMPYPVQEWGCIPPAEVQMVRESVPVCAAGFWQSQRLTVLLAHFRFCGCVYCDGYLLVFR